MTRQIIYQNKRHLLIRYENVIPQFESPLRLLLLLGKNNAKVRCKCLPRYFGQSLHNQRISGIPGRIPLPSLSGVCKICGICYLWRIPRPSLLGSLFGINSRDYFIRKLLRTGSQCRPLHQRHDQFSCGLGRCLEEQFDLLGIGESTANAPILRSRPALQRRGSTATPQVCSRIAPHRRDWSAAPWIR